MYWKVVGPHRFKLNSLVNFPGRFIYIDDNESTKYYKFCAKSAMKLLKNVVIITTLVIFAHIVVVVGPIYAFISKGSRVTTMATHLPFLEKDSDAEFMLNVTQQFVIAVVSMCANMAIEIMTCLIDNTISAIPKLIRLSLNELADEAHSEYSRLNINIRLRSVLIQIQDFDGCVSNSLILKFMIV